jgi:hypothetical protein
MSVTAPTSQAEKRDWAESLPRRRGIADQRGKGVVE